MAALLSLLLLLVTFPTLAIAKQIPGFWSIDCGGSTNFTDKKGVNWVGDDRYVQTGVRQVVSNTSDVRKELSTLRVFKSKRKNCYTIPVDQKGVKILVRVYFYYGNYDGLRAPPTFAFLFDANFWSMITTTMEGIWFAEVTYVTKRNGTSVCFARTSSDQDPFVSAIEVRSLPMSMYGRVDASRALYTPRRFAYGANKTIRYPDDTYDRMWNPLSEGFNVLKSDSGKRLNSSLDDAPPPLMFQSAVGPMIGASNLTIVTSFLPSIPVTILLNLYFSEMSNPNATNTSNPNSVRSFDFYLDGKLVYNGIVPPYRRVLELIGPNILATNNTMIDLVANSSSTLPPIISGMEVLRISNPLSHGTLRGDVEVLSMLQKRFKFLQEWTGDPCLPLNYNWEWVVCSFDASPRITELHLNGYGLSGSLPDFSALDALKIIDLHNNSLSGAIPEFLGHLPKLHILNLSMNDFSRLPPSLSNNTKISFDFSVNPKLCKPGQTCQTGPGLPSGSTSPSPSPIVTNPELPPSPSVTNTELPPSPSDSSSPEPSPSAASSSGATNHKASPATDAGEKKSNAGLQVFVLTFTLLIALMGMV